MDTKTKKLLLTISHYISIVFCIIYVVGIFTIPVAILLYVGDNFVYRLSLLKEEEFEDLLAKKTNLAWAIVCLIITFPIGVLYVIPYVNKENDNFKDNKKE